MTVLMPTLYVEAGLVPDAPVQSSTALVLNDATKGLLNTATLGTFISWTDLGNDVNSFTINRPFTRVQGPLWNYQAGTSSVVLDNSDSTYDVDNVNSPLFGGLDPMVPIRFRANFMNVNYSLYYGYADGWNPADVDFAGDYTELILGATDAFKVLAGINLAAIGLTGIGVDTGARIKDILTRAGWYTSAEKSIIDVGNSTLQGTTLGDNALALMQIAVDSEIGQLYVRGDGGIQFRNRHALLSDTRSNTVQAVFGDAPGTSHTAGVELDCSLISRASDDTTIVNDVQATMNGGSLQEVSDAASITAYLFPRSYSRSDLIVPSDAVALQWAGWVLYIGKAGENRYEAIEIDPFADPVNLWPQVLGREIGDRIQIWRRPPNGATPVVKDCFIAGISHSWDSGQTRWRTRFTLMDATKYGNFLTLNNPTLGKLNQNALAY